MTYLSQITKFLWLFQLSSAADHQFWLVPEPSGGTSLESPDNAIWWEITPYEI